MDWSKQSEEMINAWSEAQKKMWDAYLKSVEDFGKTPDQKLWEQTIDLGEQAIDNTLKAQTEWVKMWREQLKTLEDVPAQIMESTKQFQDMAGQWEKTQKQLWGNWFEMLKQFDFSKVSGAWTSEPANPFQAWQESTQKVMEAQTEWMTAWTKSMGTTQDEE
jgi:hypothetical protein